MGRPRVKDYVCGNKHKHKSERAAKQAGRRNNKRVRTYFCDFCHYWHVGSYIPKKAGL